MRFASASARRVGAAGLTVVVAGAGWWTYAAVAAGDDARYRTAEVVAADVEQTLSLSGTVAATGRADLSAGTDGDVVTVAATDGDRVRQGQVILRLDRTEAKANLAAARTDLAAARAQLAADRDAQTSAVTSAVTGTSGTTGDAVVEPGGTQGNDQGQGDQGQGDQDGQGPGQQEEGDADTAGDPTVSTALAELIDRLTKEQDAVVVAQTAASAAIDTATTALATQSTACTIEEPSTEPTTEAPTEATEAEPAEGEPADGETTSDGLSQECREALASVQSAQTAVAEAQGDLQDAVTTLGDTLTSGIAELQAAGSTGAGRSPDQEDTQDPAGSGTGDPDSGPERTGSEGTATQSTTGQVASGTDSTSVDVGGQTGSVTVTAATLARDQADIDTARAEVLAARDVLDATVVRAPVAGEVLQVSAAVGDSVSAGDALAVLVGRGVTTVEVAASEAQARQLEVGQSVAVTPAGADEALTGSVTRIQRLPTSTTSTTGATTSSYPVVITLTGEATVPTLGMPVSAAVTIGVAEDVLTVPVSALTDGAVTLLEGGRTSSVPVTTGIVGSSRVEILDGVAAGQTVVLADLTAEVATGEESQTGGFGGGSFSGGPPSGFSGGAPGMGGGR